MSAPCCGWTRHSAKVSAVTNKRLFTLSILTACLLPPTLVTGFFGMNTKDLPFQNTDGGTWWALVVAFAAAAISFWALRKLRASRRAGRRGLRSYCIAASISHCAHGFGAPRRLTTYVNARTVPVQEQQQTNNNATQGGSR